MDEVVEGQLETDVHHVVGVGGGQDVVARWVVTEQVHGQLRGEGAVSLQELSLLTITSLFCWKMSKFLFSRESLSLWTVLTGSSSNYKIMTFQSNWEVSPTR